ncbi:MAG: TolC family protein [Deltaproteobacteria bacterium]|nr:TolC family protein [Deltaproteobacteria bacterium]
MKCSAGWTAIGLMVLTLLPSQVIAQATGALQLEEVLRSVDQHFPKIRAAFEKTEAARAKQLQSEGAFDLNLHGKAQHLVRGKFPSSSIDTWVEQPTTLWGLKVEGGYRNASGFPIYNGQNVTSTNGEVRIGISIPLLRDRAIDDNRFELKNAKLGVERTSQEQRWVRLQSRLKAASVYLKWVALGQKRVVAERLLQIASVRQAGIERQIESGQIAPIERVDNQRLIISREERLVEATQQFEQAGLELGLFWRSENGRPNLPTGGSLPNWPPASIVDGDLSYDLDRAIEIRPDVLALRYAAEQLQARVEVSENRLKPTMDLRVMASQDSGDPRPYAFFAESVNETEVGAGLTFKLPVQRRKARGEVDQSLAELASISAELELATDVVRMEMQQAKLVVKATHQRTDLGRQATAAAIQMEKAERQRFDEGQSTLLLVNLRELATAETESRFIESWADHELARVALQAAAGVL